MELDTTVERSKNCNEEDISTTVSRLIEEIDPDQSGSFELLLDDGVEAERQKECIAWTEHVRAMIRATWMSHAEECLHGA